MKRRKTSNRAKPSSRRHQAQGFTILQMMITVAIIAIVSTLGVFGIVSARAQMRLAGSARQFASYAEKARADSVRRHAMGGDRASITLNNANSYSVRMDFDSNGAIDTWDTKNFNLETGVVFTSAVPTTITFDWRGRSVTGEVTPVMALGTAAGADSVLITVTGSGDITLASEIFQDAAIPNVNLGDVAGDLRPDPTPNQTGTPNPSGTPISTATPDPNATPNPNATPTPYPSPQPTATPCNNNGINCRQDPTPTPTPVPTPLPAASPTPTPIPTSGPCTLTADVSTVAVGNHVTKTITLTVTNASGSTTLSATGNTNTSHISVSLAPNQSGIVSTGSGSVQFNILVNGANQGGYITFSATSPCGAATSIRIN